MNGNPLLFMTKELDAASLAIKDKEMRICVTFSDVLKLIFRHIRHPQSLSTKNLLEMLMKPRAVHTIPAMKDKSPIQYGSKAN